MGKLPKKEESKKAKQSIWHPFTQMREWERETPTVIAEGEGVYLIDTDGKKYLDGVSSIWVNIHGHRKKEIDDALIRQIGRISHSTLLGLTNLPAIELAERLLKIAPPGLTKVFYSDDGSTAVEAAIKLAFGFWQRQGKGDTKKRKFLSFQEAYHGDTIGSVSVGGIDLFHRAFEPLLFETVKAPPPTCYRCPISLSYPSCGMACLEEVEKKIRRHRHELAGLIIEPLIQAAAGMWTAPPGYLKEIRSLCDRYDLLMIADEVATGFGRTGKMFACEHEGVTPDLMAVSKGITGGYLPLAATLTTQPIYDAYLGEYAEFKTFFHGHSYTGNPLGCAAAIANLDLFEKEKTLEKLKPKIAFVRKQLRPWKRWAHVGDIRQIGLMVGIELVADKKKKTPYPIEWRVGMQVCRGAKERGILLRPLGNVIVLMPPLSISIPELKKLIKVVGEEIRRVTSKRAKVLPLPKTILEQMLSHARREAPNECCGLLAGKEKKMNEIYPILNLPEGDPAITDLQVPPDRRFRYVMDPKEQFQAFKEMRKNGTELLGIYHSHPHSPAYPSSTDVRLAFYPDVHYLIISLEKGKPAVRAFRIVEGQITEDPIQVLL
ncbi:MAG: adenosylmethionine--8-amino-7-oxononanoate transaminase [Candidatus Manganitrophaceae bacterium]